MYLLEFSITLFEPPPPGLEPPPPPGRAEGKEPGAAERAETGTPYELPRTSANREDPGATCLSNMSTPAFGSLDPSVGVYR
jgi:hypothetical protein